MAESKTFFSISSRSERPLTIMLYILVFLLLAPAFGSQSLPLYDYPIWHDLFNSMATGPFFHSWHHVNEIIGSQGRFMPVYFLIQAFALRLNILPQISYCMLSILVALINVYLVVCLTVQLGRSRIIGIIAGVFFSLTPYTVATYWSSINAESFQISFSLAFIICSMLFVCRNRSWVAGIGAAISYCLALFLKESSAFLLPCTLLWCVMAIRHKQALKRSAILALGVSFITFGWWLSRAHYLSLAGADSYGQKLINTHLPACLKTLLIYISEIAVVTPALLLVIPVVLWVVLVNIHKGKEELETSSLAYQAGFVLMALATWVIGLSFISQITIRYELPVICLAIVLTVACFSLINHRLRKLGVVLMLLAFLNNVAGTISARHLLIQWTKCEGDLIRRVAALPRDAIVFPATTYASSGERFAQRIQWSIQKWFGRKDVSVQPLAGRLEIPPDGHLVIAREKWASEWCNFGWHPGKADAGSLPEQFALSSLKAEDSVRFEFYGWQIRGWHFLVLAKRLLQRDSAPAPPLGLIQYQASFDFYNRPQKR